MSEKESAKPIAYRFKNNRGNGRFEYDYYDADEVSSAYRDNCIEITPLYTADCIDQLEKELIEARKDAERWRWANSNAEWHLGEAHAFIAIRVAKDADLSCKATREDAIDAAMKETP